MHTPHPHHPDKSGSPVRWGGWLQRTSSLREVACLPALLPPGANPLHVLQLTNMYPSQQQPNRGAFVRSQVESLSQCGVVNEVVEIQGYLSTWNYLRALATLPWRVGSHRYDLIHLHFGYTALAAVALRRHPTVLSFCGDDLLGQPDVHGRPSAKSRLLAALCKCAARRADAIIVKSREMAEVLGPMNGRVEVIPNGLDLSFFQPMPRDQARAALGWPLNAEILFFPADAREARKNFALAETVCARLRAKGRPVRLVQMFGRHQNDIRLGMAGADVLLSCSLQEGSPNAVKEAMAMNLPVVATAVGDCAERLAHCSPGAVVPNDVDTFTAATEAVLRHGGMRSNGREQVASLSAEVVAHQVLAVYQRAMARFKARRRPG
jgi:glycosyltransferase involved in cell wall biosynthesis